MNKAFITKLPITIENSNIPYFGECVIHAKTKGTHFYMDTEKDVKVWFDKSTNYMIASTTETTGTSCIVPAKKRLTVTIPTDGLDIHVAKKYDITSLLIDGNGILSVKADDVKYMKDLRQLGQLGKGAVELIGDLSALSGLTQITALCIRNDSNTLTGDLSALSGLTKLTNIYINDNSNSLTGDVLAFTDLNNLQECRLYGVSLIGDLTTLSKSCYFFDTNINSFSWTKGKRVNTTLLSNSSGSAWNLGNYVDDMLIDQALNTVRAGNNIIKVKGNRTSASDSALAALQKKGVTVTILN